jgi:site-specific recombinase
MNWTRTLLASVVGGIAMWLASFLLHGFVLGATYMKYTDVFSQEQASPLSFLIIEVLIAFPAAVIFAKTRRSWSAGLVGGLVFGFWLGLGGAFAQHFNPLVMEGFPYYLAWCWFGTNMIVALVLGAVLGVMIKAPATA